MSHSLKAKRVRAYNSQNGRCYYCEIQMWLNDPQDHYLRSSVSSAGMVRIRCTAEHVQARSDGGSNAKENIVAACWFCNQARHRRPRPVNSQAFRAFVKSRMRAQKWHPAQFHQRCGN